MRRALFILLSLVLVSTLNAAGDGGQPAAFLKRGLGARPMGYGGAHTAVADDVYAAFYNPAGAVQLKEMQIGSQLAFLPGGRQFHLLSTLQPTASGNAFYGVAWARMTLSDAIEKRTKNTPDPLELLSDTQDAFFLTLASKLPVLGASWGMNIKYISQKLGEANGNGFGLDFGLFYELTADTNLAISVEDAYTRLDWSTGLKEIVPVQTRLAAASRFFEERLTLMAEAEISTEQSLKGRGGAEWWVLRGTAALRAGWDVNKATAGFGVNFPVHKRWQGRFDYALATDPSGSSEFTHRASMTVVFIKAPPKEIDIKPKENLQSEEEEEEVPDELEEKKEFRQGEDSLGKEK